MQVRLHKILNAIMQHDNVLNGGYLSKLLNVSSRTIQKDMKILNDTIVHYGAVIQSIPSTGYKLEIKDADLFNRFTKDAAMRQVRETDIPNDTKERTLYILRRLLLADDYVKQDELAEEMFVSKSTIQKLMKEVKEKLSSYHITIPSKSSLGLKVEGTEFNIRSCISEYCFLRDVPNPFDLIQELVKETITEEQIQDVRKLLITSVHQHNIHISEWDFEDLFIHVLVSIKRMKDGIFIKEEDIQEKDILPLLTSTVVSDLLDEMESIFHVTIPRLERAYLCILLLGKKILPKEFDQEHHPTSDIHAYIDDMLSDIFSKMTIDLRSDAELKSSLFHHLNVMLKRLKYQLNFRNPILKEIKEKYPLSFELAFIAAESLKRSLKIDIHEEEVGYLAIHLETSMQRMDTNAKPVRCLVVCSTGTGTAQLLKLGISKHLGNQVEIVDVKSYFALPQMNLQDVDLIISTIELNQSLPVPYIKVSPILSEQDLLSLKKKIRTIHTNVQDEIVQFIKDDLIFLQMDFSTPDQVIEYVCQNIIDRRLATPDMTQLVLEREAVSPTSFGNLVAIPHPIRNVSCETFLAFCILKKPIKWGNKMVQLACFFNIKKHNEVDLQYLYEFLYTMINKKKIVESLLKCESSPEFLSLLYAEERGWS